MSTRYSALYDSIQKLYLNNKSPELLDAPANFPLKKIYKEQQSLLTKIKPDESLCLTSHTGFGKTPMFLTLTNGRSALIIEPRKFLQKQVSTYRNDFVLYGRSEYPCLYAMSAASAPCLLKESCDGTDFHKTCKLATPSCLTKPCKVFPYKGTYLQFPCQDCEYLAAIQNSVRILKSGGSVICNFGNFWNLLKYSDIVVIDEADLFFKEISSPMRLQYTSPKTCREFTIKSLLKSEVDELTKELKTTYEKYSVTNRLYNAQFMLANSELCFMYQRKDRFYIETDPRNTNILCKKLFKGKQVIIVSATPGKFDYPAYSASIHQRCGIYFAPVGNLTSRSLKQNPYLLSSAAKAITEISTYMELVYDADKVVVHCGNIGTHATGLYRILGEDDCILHESGKLAQTIDKFLESGKKYLLVASAEFGGDFGWCKLQFVLKFPYPSLDERMNTLKRVMGPEFSAYYEGDARTRVIQMAGRNVRGFDDFGITVCLDSKCHEDFVRHPEMYPSWFKERVDRRVY